MPVCSRFRGEVAAASLKPQDFLTGGNAGQGFPRRSRRGLIEAAIAHLMGFGKHCFRGEVAAASLKRILRTFTSTVHNSFRGEVAAASLKPENLGEL